MCITICLGSFEYFVTTILSNKVVEERFCIGTSTLSLLFEVESECELANLVLQKNLDILNDGNDDILNATMDKLFPNGQND